MLLFKRRHKTKDYIFKTCLNQINYKQKNVILCKIIYILNFIHGAIFLIATFTFTLSAMAKRIAVIGAGAAGLCAARHLSASPDLFSVVCFDMSSTVGGTWNYTDLTGKDEHGLPVQSSMYKNLRSVTSR